MLDDSEHLRTKLCANLHGHTYAVEVTFDGENDRNGMVVDFKAVKDLIDVFDHTTILRDCEKNRALENLTHKIKPFVFFEGQPTAENIAREIRARILGTYPDLKNVTVKVCEGYKGLERANFVEVQ